MSDVVTTDLHLPTGAMLLAQAAQRRRLAMLGLVVVLVAAIVAGVVCGAHRLDLVAALRGVGDVDRGLDTTVLLSLRVPRVLLGLFVGAGLAIAGATVQALVRNPLADPGLLGASAGAAFGAAMAVVVVTGLLHLPDAARVDHPLLIALTPIAAFIGAVSTLLIVMRLARPGDGGHLLLVGIGLNGICGAGLGLLTALADDAQLRALSFWSLGSLGSANLLVAGAAAVVVVPATLLLLTQARALSMLGIGEQAARLVGVDVTALTTRTTVLAGLALAAAVSSAGVVGFVGFLAPHLARQVVGADARDTLPASAILGAALVVASDTIARTINAPAELPLGVITAALGAPAFLLLVLRRRRP